MTDFKKSSRFSKDSRPGGYSRGGDRPSFGGPGFKRDSGETFKATCSKCHKSCDVPFRPNGKKPVFCRDCFVRDDARPTGGTYEKRSFNQERSFSAPQQTEDPRIGAMQRELTTIHAKLDGLIKSLEGAAYSSIISASVEREEKPAKATAKPKAVKKVAKKK